MIKKAECLPGCTSRTDRDAGSRLVRRNEEKERKWGQEIVVATYAGSVLQGGRGHIGAMGRFWLPFWCDIQIFAEKIKWNVILFKTDMGQFWYNHIFTMLQSKENIWCLFLFDTFGFHSRVIIWLSLQPQSEQQCNCVPFFFLSVILDKEAGKKYKRKKLILGFLFGL